MSEYEKRLALIYATINFPAQGSALINKKEEPKRKYFKDKNKN